MLPAVLVYVHLQLLLSKQFLVKALFRPENQLLLIFDVLEKPNIFVISNFLRDMTLASQIAILTWKEFDSELQWAFMFFGHHFNDSCVHRTNLNQSWLLRSDHECFASSRDHFMKFFLKLPDIVTNLQDLLFHSALIRRWDKVHLMFQLLFDLLE